MDRPTPGRARQLQESIVWPRPMREPVFTETLQVGIVVRDLEAAMRTYVHDALLHSHRQVLGSG
jgi:hypothetical protein